VPGRPATGTVSGEVNPFVAVNTSLEIVPNPATEEAAVYYTQPSAGTLLLMTPEGKTISRFALSENTGQLILNLKDYHPGIYLISLRPDSGTALFRKLVVIR
jgi:hypothetical protein